MSTGKARTESARADLHTHSTASDGLLAPADLIRQASRRGLSVVALTDHDTTRGLAEALAAGAEMGILVVPGVELSTDVAGGQLHMLGYGIDPESERLSSVLAGLRAAREDRAAAIIERLRALGIEIDLDSVRPAREGESLGRPHIARAMVAAGYVESVAEAFERYIGDDGPAYVRAERMTPEDAVRLIVDAGGIAVLAHPYTFPSYEERLPSLIAAGLEGIEVYYAAYSDEQVRSLERVAEKHGLLATGGSDYHGDISATERVLGAANIPGDVLERFLRRLAQRDDSTD